MTRAGVIGLGQIGGGVAVCLARAGLLAAVYDIRQDATAGLPGVAASLHSPAQVAAHCDVVLIAVVDAEQTQVVLGGPNGVLSRPKPGLVVVMLSTIALHDLARLRQLCADAGVILVDSGVTGGLLAAQNGLICLVGADPEPLATIRPVLNGFARTVVHMGGPGTGMAAKLARNVIVYNIWRAAYEGAQLAEAAGIDIPKLAEAIDASADSTDSPTLWLTRPADPHTDAAERTTRETGVKLLRNDLDAALALAAQHGITLPMAKLTHESARAITGLDPKPTKPPLPPAPPAAGTGEPAQDDRIQRGLDTFEKVYGPGSSDTLVGADRSDFSTETISHLFGEIWSRPNLAIRDRRLMLIGVSAMLGRSDLIEVQIRGAIANGELTMVEIDEIPLFLAFYIGWCNSGPLYRGILAAKRALAAP